MGIFDFLSEKDTKKKRKATEPPSSPKGAAIQAYSREPAIISSKNLAPLTYPQLVEFFLIFKSIAMAVESLPLRLSSVRKTRDLCLKMRESQARLMIAEEKFHPSYEILSFLEGILQEEPPVRNRHIVALARFAAVLTLEFEEEQMSTPNGFVSAIANPNIAEAPEKIEFPPIPKVKHLDLRNIYTNLMTDLEYLPSLEEYAEILRRASKLLAEEPNVLSINLPVVVVGDLHGQMADLVEQVIPRGGPLIPEISLDSPESPRTREAKKRTYLFLGDFVDRGRRSLQCLCLLYVAKLLSPETVFLIRGNHECALTNRMYGLLAECLATYPIVDGEVSSEPNMEANFSDEPNTDLEHADHPLWSLANESFKCLPLAAALIRKQKEALPPIAPVNSHESVASSETPDPPPITNGTIILAMHGGLSPSISNSIDGILAIDRFRDLSSGAIADLTWSDPITADDEKRPPPPAPPRPGVESFHQRLARTASLSDFGTAVEGYHLTSPEEMATKDFTRPAVYKGPPVGYRWSQRGTGHGFGEDATCNFINTNHLHYLIRAHQCVKDGYKWYHSERVLTIFSAPNYCNLKNKGAIALIDGEGRPIPMVFKAEKDRTRGLPSPHSPKMFQ